jgi:hypothetical protein
MDGARASAADCGSRWFAHGLGGSEFRSVKKRYSPCGGRSFHCCSFARKYDRCVYWFVCLGMGREGGGLGRRGRRQPLLYDVSIIAGDGAFFISSFLAGEKGGTKAGDLKLTVSRGSFSPTLKLLVGSAWVGGVWCGGVEGWRCVVCVCVCVDNRRCLRTLHREGLSFDGHGVNHIAKA